MLQSAWKMSQDTVNFDKLESGFLADVARRSGENVSLCWHCRGCSNGCPFADSMDYLPNQVLRLVQLGMKKKAIECSAAWICVGCNTCSVECPQAIDMAAVMDAIRAIALEEKAAIGQPDIFKFHQEVVNSIRRHGRTHKLEIMLRYKMIKKDWFSDMNLGLRMLSNRKLDLMPSRVKKMSSIRAIFAKSGGKKT